MIHDDFDKFVNKFNVIKQDLPINAQENELSKICEDNFKLNNNTVEVYTERLSKVEDLKHKLNVIEKKIHKSAILILFGGGKKLIAEKKRLETELKSAEAHLKSAFANHKLNYTKAMLDQNKQGPINQGNSDVRETAPNIKQLIMMQSNKCYRSDIHTREAEKLLQDRAILPGTLLITKSYSYPTEYPFVASIKLPNRTVTKSIIKLDDTGPIPVFRVLDNNLNVVKVGGGTGFPDLNICLQELVRHELKNAQAERRAIVAAQQQQIQLDPLEERASQLAQDLQGLRATFKEMGCPEDQIDVLIKQFSLTIAKFEGDTRTENRFRKNQITYTDLGVKFPFTFHLKKNPETGGLNINFTTPGIVLGAKVGEGTYKIVKKSHSIDIPPKGSLNKPMTKTQDVVLIRARKGYETNVSMGFDLVRNLQQELGPDVKLPGLPIERRYYAKDGTERLELVQEFYNGDFQKAIDSGTLPIGMNTAQHKQFNVLDNMDILISVADTLAKFHAKGYVHRDVKGPNILVKIDSSQSKPQGFINDFDLTAKIGLSETESDYLYWDPCTRVGLVTPNADVYGLVMTLGQSYFPNFYGIMGTPTTINDPNFTLSNLLEGKLSPQFEKLGIQGDPICQSIYEGLQIFADHPKAHPVNFNNWIISNLTALIDSGRLDSAQVQQVRNLQAELSALPSIWRVILTTVNRSHQVLQEVNNNPVIKSKLESGDVNENSEGMQLVMQVMQTRGPPNMEAIKREMARIQAQIQNQLVTT